MKILAVISIVCLAALFSQSTARSHGKSSAGDWPPPPKWEDKAKTARYLAHYAPWGVVSAVSPQHGYIPFGTLQDISDGPLSQSTGTPYFYIAKFSDTHNNLAYNNSATLALSQAQSNYCTQQSIDPEEPLCARVTLTGNVVNVTDAEEQSFAKSALFGRHPAMKGWPSDHGWAFYKLKITGVFLVDYYGPATAVALKDYFAADPTV